jgi:transcriptional regulator with XRE-family HTH domain
VRTLRAKLLRTALGLSQELAEQFPFSVLELRELDREPFEALVNAICARLDLPVLRRLELLSLDVVSRSDSLLRQLEVHRNALDQLRPFRPLAAHPELN